MSQRGVHFALTQTQVSKLRRFADDEGRLDHLQSEIEEKLLGGRQKYAVESDKAWDPIHRALSDGRLTWTGGKYPLNHVVLGGESLYAGDDYVMSLKTPSQVCKIAAALDSMSLARFRKRYYAIDQDDYSRELNDEDLDYAWTWFEDVREFYRRAAAAERFVLFTVDGADVSASEPRTEAEKKQLAGKGSACANADASDDIGSAISVPKLDDDQWCRVGGSWVGCGAPVADFVAALQTRLPGTYAPYVVVGEDVLPLELATDAEKAKRQRSYIELWGEDVARHRMNRPKSQFFRRLFVYPLTDIERALDESPNGHARDRLWLGSLTLSPWLRELTLSDDDGTLIINGFTLLDFGGTKGKRHIGSLTAVIKIRHQETGKLHKQLEYGEIYREVTKVARACK